MWQLNIEIFCNADIKIKTSIILVLGWFLQSKPFSVRPAWQTQDTGFNAQSSPSPVTDDLVMTLTLYSDSTNTIAIIGLILKGQQAFSVDAAVSVPTIFAVVFQCDLLSLHSLIWGCFKVIVAKTKILSMATLFYWMFNWYCLRVWTLFAVLHYLLCLYFYTFSGVWVSRGQEMCIFIRNLEAEPELLK